MKLSKEAIAQIKYVWEKFCIGFDSQEELKWDTAELGEMDAYYANEALCIAIRLIAADGQFTQEEADCLNEIFGYGYTVDTLKEVYVNLGDVIERVTDEDLDDGIRLMRRYNSDMASEYKIFLDTFCKAVLSSDSQVTEDEREAADQILKSIALE